MTEGHIMLIDEIIDFCDNMYSSNPDIIENCICTECSHPTECPGKCDECLCQIHYKNNDEESRHSYDCKNLTNFYVCKYAYKYASELIYAFKKCRSLKSLDTLKILSIGCGPCTDLMAIDYLSQADEYGFNNLVYIGIDLLEQPWKNIHNMIQEYFVHDSVRFIYDDILIFIDKIIDRNWSPDVIVFQYFFSDLQKNVCEEKILDFIDRIAYYINNKMCDNTYVIFNDINLSREFNGGLDYFDILLSKINHKIYRRLHFNNSNHDNHFEYGTEYPCNDLFFNISQVQKYRPFDSCASAQLIIKKIGD